MTPRGALQVDGATESAVPQVGRIPVPLPFTFDDDTTPEPFDPMGILVVEYARAVTVRARARDRWPVHADPGWPSQRSYNPHRPHFLIRRSSPSAHARATA